MSRVLKVVKRNGNISEFDINRIINAIEKAMSETVGGIDGKLSRQIANEILMDVQNREKAFFGLQYHEEGNVTVEEIQDMVEVKLMKDRPDVAKKYILYREERSKVRHKGWEMTDLQKDIYEKKYRFNNESFEDFLERVSDGDNDIKKLMRDKKFIAGGRILAGRKLPEYGKKITYSNCFVISPPEDNIESIFQSASDMARIFSYGGGVGVTIKNLRPRNAEVNNSARSSSGAVSFMDLYSTTTEIISQAGRRAALILTLPVDHPDIEEFIDVKNDLNKVTKANISVGITDDFMKAVKNNEDWELKFTVNDGKTLKNYSKIVKAKELFRKIAQSAWNMAEPGVLFWDNINNYHINDHTDGFKYEACNPCGEKPLIDNATCLLGSFNLSEFVKYPFTEKSYFDFESFKQAIPMVVRYIDDVLEEGIPYLPLAQQRQIAIDWRQIGIGVMGLHDMLIKMQLKYGTKESLYFVDKVMRVLGDESLKSSAMLAKEKGVYLKYKKEQVLKSNYINFVASDETKKLIEQYGLRNSEIISVAPTGSVSTMFGVSGGTEPVFQFIYTRKTESLHGKDTYYKVFTPIVKQYMEANDISDVDQLPDYFIQSQDIPYEDRIKMQAVLQKYVDSAISSTVNLPQETTVEQVEDLYMKAWENGLKGITIYRDGCARAGILITDKTVTNKKTIDELQTELAMAITEALKQNPNDCPMCGDTLIHTNGCKECQSCGYSPCSL